MNVYVIEYFKDGVEARLVTEARKPETAYKHLLRYIGEVDEITRFDEYRKGK